jgi:glycosyltransferase involved in cell wall biosynthesis
VLGASSERNRELAGLSIKFLPQVSAEMVANVYKFAKYVWVHSNNEGFGRSIVEARLAGKVVIASNIEAFRAQSDSSVFLYGTEAQFIKSVSDASSYVAKDPYVCKYNSIAIRSLDEWLT